MLALLLTTLSLAAVQAAEIAQLRVERADDNVYLSAMVQFELPPQVEDALNKGIPMFFVAQADITQSRWYWTDKKVANATRTLRLSFQPLTRRWRVNVLSPSASSPDSGSGLRTALNQNYETLADALLAIKRFARWKIAEVSDLEPDANLKVVFSFNLDVSQLPRPFQIGVVGQKDWNISATQSLQLLLGSARAASAPVLPASATVAPASTPASNGVAPSAPGSGKEADK